MGELRLLVADTGEILEWAMEGVDPSPWVEDEVQQGEHWVVDSLPLALNLVPTITAAIERARDRGESVEVHVRASKDGS